MLRVIVIASTFPARNDDPVPGFVKEQVIALKQAYPDIIFSVLAPHDARSQTVSHIAHPYYDEYRFHYVWPFRFETLAGRGIIPALQQNPARYVLVPFLIIAECAALLRLTRQVHADVIYAHWFTPQGMAAGIVSMITGIPFVYTSHSSDVAILRKLPLLGPWAVRHFTRKARAITVVSRRSFEKLHAFFPSKMWQEVSPKIAIIPMGISVPPAGIRNRTRPPESEHILFIGRLAEKKGVQYLLPAFACLCETHPNAVLTIAGDGPWRARLEMQAKGLHLSDEHLIFRGYVSGSHKAALINQADTWVVPSVIAPNGDAEGLPVTLMEGLAAGKICIATNESGADDILEDGKNGYLVPHKDIQALARTLDKALSLAPQQRANIGLQAIKTAQQFAWPTIAKRHYLHLFPMPTEARDTPPR